MKVIVKQRKADKDTLEKHEYTKENVKKVQVYKSLNSEYFVKLTFDDTELSTLHLSLEFFDFEIIE